MRPEPPQHRRQAIVDDLPPGGVVQRMDEVLALRLLGGMVDVDQQQRRFRRRQGDGFVGLAQGRVPRVEAVVADSRSSVAMPPLQLDPGVMAISGRGGDPSDPAPAIP